MAWPDALDALGEVFDSEVFDSLVGIDVVGRSMVLELPYTCTVRVGEDHTCSAIKSRVVGTEPQRMLLKTPPHVNQEVP